MLPDPVAYIHYTHSSAGALTLPHGKAYAYIFAGNGVYKLAENRHLRALIPISTCRIVGRLPISAPYVRLQPFGQRLPGHLLGRILADARREAWERPREAMYHFAMKEGKVHVTKPEQETSAGQVAYQGGDDPDIILDLHSHHQMAAFYSGTDNRDEGGFRLYGVMGRIFTRPELRLRVGVYGDHWEIPVTALFTDTGPFRDTFRGGTRED